MTDAQKTPLKPRKDASWTDVKARLTTFDRAGLLGLLQDMYALSKDNQTFLHSRFSLGGDVLIPYKIAIDDGLYPDWVKNKNPSVTKAKKAIADLPEAQRPALWMRLSAAHHATHNLGYGVYDDLGDLFARYGANG